MITLKEPHEDCRKGQETIKEGFECRFCTDEQCHKINHLVAAHATPREANLLADRFKQTMFLEQCCHDRHLAQPRWCRGNQLGRGLDFYWKMSDTSQISVLLTSIFQYFLKENTFLSF